MYWLGPLFIIFPHRHFSLFPFKPFPGEDSDFQLSEKSSSARNVTYWVKFHEILLFMYDSLCSETESVKGVKL